MKRRNLVRRIMLLLVLLVLSRFVSTEAILRMLLAPRFAACLAIALTLNGSLGLPASGEDFESRFNRGTETPAPGDAPVPTEFDTKKNDELLREGTLIPPTIGKIIPVGRRWGFAPSNPELLSRKHLETGISAARSLSSGLVSKPYPTRIGAASLAADTREVGLPLRQSEIAPPPTPSLPSPGGADTKVKHIILAENLMLQRIVDAVVADSADDRWTISGEVTEFRNQNRLRITTAQRTNDR